jgi:hypothetical protein
LIESGFYPYEDREIHFVNNGEDPLDYYRCTIERHYFPLDKYWSDHFQPDEVLLQMYSNSFGFVFTKGINRYEGYAKDFSDWERA